MTMVALGLLRSGDRWFLQRRDSANLVLPGRWEFPGGKVESRESLEAALVRELREEVGIEVRQARPMAPLAGKVCLHPYLVDAAGCPRTELAWGWFTAEEMSRLPIPPANLVLIARLADDPATYEAR